MGRMGANMVRREAAWAAVDPVLERHGIAHPYRRHTWSPPETDALIVGDGGWHNPTAGGAPS
jgi:glucose-6-phosphate 1-dehydrogenase